MKRLKSVLWLILIVVSMFSASAMAASSFSFTFANTGTKCSSAITKSNSSTSASVNVTTAGSYTYKYAVAKGQYTNYVTSWKSKTGTGTFSIPYTSTLSNGSSVRLHGATVSSSGTSTIAGTWTP